MQDSMKVMQASEAVLTSDGNDAAAAFEPTVPDVVDGTAMTAVITTAEAADVAVAEAAPASNIEAAPAGKVAIPDLVDGSTMATVITAAEAIDIEVAMAGAAAVEAGETDELSADLDEAGKKLQRAATQLKSSHKSLYSGMIDVLMAAEIAYQRPQAIVALASEKGIKTTMASWRTPFLVPLKIAQPDLDNKTASLYARALNYVAAMNLSGDVARRFLEKHGVGALAAEEAKRQKARKQGQPATPAEDPAEVFCRTRTPAPLPEELRPAGLGKDIRLALMIVGNHEGRFVAWGVDTDEKRTLAAVRQAAKREQPDGWPTTKVETDQQE